MVLHFSVVHLRPSISGQVLAHETSVTWMTYENIRGASVPVVNSERLHHPPLLLPGCDATTLAEALQSRNPLDVDELIKLLPHTKASACLSAHPRFRPFSSL